MTRALDPLTYPLRGAHRGDAVGAAWALLLAHGFLPYVALVPVAGVLLRVLVGSAGGIDEPPAVTEDVLDLLVRSAGGLVLALVYVGPPLVYLVAVLEFVSTSGTVDGGSLTALAAATVGGVGILVATYLLPVALAGYGASGSLRVGFDRARLRDGARSGRYLLGWLAGVVVIDVGGLAATWVGTASPISAVSTALIAGYALVVGARIVGLGLVGSGVVAPLASTSEENP